MLTPFIKKIFFSVVVTAPQLFYKSAFDGKLNFEYMLNFNHHIFKTDTYGYFKNQTLQNNFKVFFTPHPFVLIKVTSDYYVPNLKQFNEAYHFVDFKTSYSPKNKNYSLAFTFKNILNNQNFKQTQVSDYSTSIYNFGLIPRLITLDLSYRF